ncbi:hypothetical protein [Yersinia phage MHG19]|nr:hypothetical protein [Yersinia phage MHG19]
MLHTFIIKAITADLLECFEVWGCTLESAERLKQRGGDLVLVTVDACDEAAYCRMITNLIECRSLYEGFERVS